MYILNEYYASACKIKIQTILVTILVYIKTETTIPKTIMFDQNYF